jgi:vitamin B12 transporter
MTGLIRREAARRKGPGHAALTSAVLLATGLPVAAQADQAAPAPAQATPAPDSTDNYPPPEEAQPAPDIAPVPVTTLATGSKLPLDKVAQPITVLDRDDIARAGGGDITRVLDLVPGLTWTREGAPGANTAVHLRGGGANDVLVTIDGVRMQDVAAIGGGFDFGTLTSTGIERIDVLRGTNSVVWGSGAIGGVIALTTPETKGVVASAETGSRNTVQENLAAGIRKDRYAISFDAGYTATDSVGGYSDDAPGGYHQWTLSGRGRYNLTEALSVIATMRYADGKESGNAFPLPLELSGTAAQALETEQVSGRVGAHYEKGGVTLDTGYAVASTRRIYVVDNAADSDVAAIWHGRSDRVDMSGAIKLPAGFMAHFGADDEWSGYSGTYDTDHRMREDSGHLLIGWYGPVATLTAGIRVDDNSQFGSHDSYQVNASVKLLEGVRLRGGYAEGFKAPTLYQLWSAYGNARLAPETSQSYDGGVEYSGDDGRIRLAASAYRRDSRNLIDFTGCAVVPGADCVGQATGSFENVGVARAQGIELEALWVPTAKWRFSAVYSYDHATNRTPGDSNAGKELAHRPADAATVSADWTTPFKGVVLGADLRVQSASWDDAANTVRLGSGEVTTLRASLPFGNFLEFFGRLENLFNDHTPTEAGYQTVGRGGFVGIRVRY